MDSYGAAGTSGRRNGRRGELEAQQRGQLAAGVLAGERPGPSELSDAEQVPLKVFVDIAGRPMLARVLDVIAEATPDALHIVAGPDEVGLRAAPWLQAAVAEERLMHLPPAHSPSRSARAVVEAAYARGARAVAVTTGDHPLLTARTFRRFVDDALATDADAVVGLADHAAVKAAFPASRRTALRFSDGHRCGCNMFLFRGFGALRVLDLWREVEQDRKRPDRILRRLGPGLAVRYLAGRLELAEALDRLGELADARVAVVRVEDPDAAVDVDNLEDLATVRARWAQRADQPTDDSKT
ncbi:MAG: NTP transferase domain-containing protein [Pseudomonadales bacterium]|jgi:CTP:molybdopterin cytidylyltransferase MocA|nr:NTP transferase domain-containing protein [Pseudomonadales bacterium]